MKCPECGAWSLVKDTRDSETFGHMRRRECANYHKFTTQEVAIPQAILKAKQREAALANIAKGRAKRMAFYEGRRKTTRETA